MVSRSARIASTHKDSPHRSPQPIVRCRSGRPRSDAETTSEEGSAHHHQTVNLSHPIFCDNDRRRHDVHLSVRPLRRRYVKTRTDYGQSCGRCIFSSNTAPQTFTCFVFLDLVSALQNRGLGCGITQNSMLVTTVSISFLVQLTLIYVPFMQSIFQTEALSMSDISRLLFIAGLSFTLHETRRRYERAQAAEQTYVSITQELA